MKYYQEELKTQTQVHSLLELNSLGVKVEEVRIIPDVEETIINSVNLLRNNTIMFSLQEALVPLTMI